MKKATVVESEKLHKSLINFATVTTGIDSISSTFNTLLSVSKELTSAYAVQEEAEAKLEQVMRCTMNARDEDIQSIKEFCSAQQQIGVIGDEVQLTGAQERSQINAELSKLKVKYLFSSELERETIKVMIDCL